MQAWIDINTFEFGSLTFMHASSQSTLMIVGEMPLQLKSRRDMLQEYVKSVQPEFMEKFVKRAPEQVNR